MRSIFINGDSFLGVMAEGISLKEIVEDSYETIGLFIGYIGDDGLDFDYQLRIADKEYKKEFADEDMKYIGNHFLNELIRNSLKALLGIKELDDIIKGRYDKSIFQKKTPRIEVGLDIENEDYVLTVKDNGSGIPPDNQEEIWKNAFSTFGTSGIGLAQLKDELTKYYNGRTELNSVPDVETTIKIYIPINGPTA